MIGGRGGGLLNCPIYYPADTVSCSVTSLLLLFHVTRLRGFFKKLWQNLIGTLPSNGGLLEV